MSLLEARNVGKRYGPVVALESASLSVDAGEVHALLGANGAGKSTLVKILTGVIQRDGGTVELRGEPVRVSSPSRAARIGLAPVFQDPALVPDLTVAQNIRLTAVDVDAVRQRLREMDVDVDFTEQAGDVPLPLLRMIDLARAMARDARAVHVGQANAALGKLIRRIEPGRVVHGDLGAEAAVAEVGPVAHFAVADTHQVRQPVPREIGERQIVEYMLGPEAATAEAHAAEVDETPLKGAAAAEAAATTLEVTDLRVGSLAGVSFSLRAGEILGVAALEGQGQNDLFAVLAGDRRAEGGEMSVTGKSLRPRHPYDAIRSGLVLVPADRLLALLPQRSVRENIAAPRYNRLGRWGPINPREERRRVASAIEALQIDTRAQRQVRRLSGGNQQKVTIARWLASGFQTLLCFDPTRGIDVGTKRQIYALLRRLADDGAAILFFSSELSEFPLVCDRVLTLFGGRITGELAGEGADEASLLRAMHGLVEEVAS